MRIVWTETDRRTLSASAWQLVKHLPLPRRARIWERDRLVREYMRLVEADAAAAEKAREAPDATATPATP